MDFIESMDYSWDIPEYYPESLLPLLEEITTKVTAKIISDYLFSGDIFLARFPEQSLKLYIRKSFIGKSNVNPCDGILLFNFSPRMVDSTRFNSSKEFSCFYLVFIPDISASQFSTLILITPIIRGGKIHLNKNHPIFNGLTNPIDGCGHSPLFSGHSSLPILIRKDKDKCDFCGSRLLCNLNE